VKQYHVAIIASVLLAALGAQAVLRAQAARRAQAAFEAQAVPRAYAALTQSSPHMPHVATGN
jgi:Flp pilus assembly protein CpaB